MMFIKSIKAIIKTMDCILWNTKMRIEYATYIKHNKEWDETISKMIECPINSSKEASQLFPSSPAASIKILMPSTDR
jgi:hypothetical protein